MSQEPNRRKVFFFPFLLAWESKIIKMLNSKKLLTILLGQNFLSVSREANRRRGVFFLYYLQKIEGIGGHSTFARKSKTNLIPLGDSPFRSAIDDGNLRLGSAAPERRRCRRLHLDDGDAKRLRRGEEGEGGRWGGRAFW